MHRIHPYLLYFSAKLGTSEERIEAYKTYVERAPQILTTLGAKSIFRKVSFAYHYEDAVKEIWNEE